MINSVGMVDSKDLLAPEYIKIVEKLGCSIWAKIATQHFSHDRIAPDMHTYAHINELEEYTIPLTRAVV